MGEEDSRQKLHYFGPVTQDGDHGAQAALERWLDQKDDLLAGRTPRIKGDSLTVRELVNRFLTLKQAALDCGELVPRTFQDYHQTCGLIVSAFGRDRLVTDLAADDFEKLRAAVAKRNGPTRLGNEVQRIRTIFKYAADSGLDPQARPLRLRIPEAVSGRAAKAPCGERATDVRVRGTADDHRRGQDALEGGDSLRGELRFR